MLLSKVKFDKEELKYTFPIDEGDNKMKVLAYEPIRIKIYQSGKMVYISNRVDIDNNDHLLIHQKR